MLYSFKKTAWVNFFTVSELTELNALNKLSPFVSSLVYNTATPQRKHLLA